MPLHRRLLAAAAFLAVPGVTRAQEARTLRIGSALDPQHPIIIGARRMAERLEELSGGRLRAAIFPSSQLGAQREMWQNVQAGVLDGVIDASANMVNFVASSVCWTCPTWCRTPPPLSDCWTGRWQRRSW
jgi:TRAP-type transport system periplasmic protein